MPIQLHSKYVFSATTLVYVCALSACSDDSNETPTPAQTQSTPVKSAASAATIAATSNPAPAADAAVSATSTSAPSGFDPQLPPTKPGEIGKWLDAGYYKAWSCETTATAKTDGAAAIHVHGAKSRICANVLLAATPAPQAGKEFPKGVAAVKEVYDEKDELLGRFVELKVEASSDAGNGWYWYKDASGVAEGLGLEGCTGCHGAAGSDADHPGAGDYVYFQQTNPKQIPLIGDIETVQHWLEMKYYEDWACEPEPTIKTAGAAGTHVHGANRVCSNQLLSMPAPAAGMWPAGVAAVKELFDAEGKQTGAAVYLKVQNDSAAGAGWYWFESPSIVGFGNGVCTGCHGAAGSDADHPGLDYVYFRKEQ